MTQNKTRILFHFDVAMICLLHWHCNLRYSGDLLCLQLVWKIQEYTHPGFYASVNIWRSSALKRSQNVPCHSEKKIQALNANSQLKRIPLNVGHWWTKNKTWMQTNPHFGKVKISSGGSLFLTISLWRGWPQPSSLGWGGSAGRPKERGTQKNRLWSVIRQRSTRKLVTSISTTKKKIMSRETHDIMKTCPSSGFEHAGGCHNHAFLLRGLAVETHLKCDQVYLM